MQIKQEYIKFLPKELQIEVSENLIRKEFTLSELVEIWKTIQKSAGGRGNKLVQMSERVYKPIKTFAKIIGKSTDTLSKAKQVVESGDKKLIQQMDKTGNVNRAYRKVKQNERAEKRKLIIPKNINIDFQCGDFRKLVKNIPDNSIDLILTDPPYPKEYLPLWEDLAKSAKRILKPSGFLIAYSGQPYLIEILNFLNKYLDYYWIGALYHQGPTSQNFSVNMWSRSKPILFFQKPPRKKQPEWLEDVVISEKQNKDFHKWGQSVAPFEKIINHFSEPNDIICDPFTGGGSVIEACINTKRNFIGFEIDKKYYNLVNKNI